MDELPPSGRVPAETHRGRIQQTTNVCVVINAAKHQHMPRPGRTAGGGGGEGVGWGGGEEGTLPEIRNVDGQSLQFVGSEHKANKGQLL